MKLKLLLTSLIIVWGTGCIAYTQHPDEVQVQIEPPTTIVSVSSPPVVRHVHVQRTRPVVRHVHVQRTRPVVRHVRVQRTRTVVRHTHRHTRSCQHVQRATRSNRNPRATSQRDRTRRPVRGSRRTPR